MNTSQLFFSSLTKALLLNLTNEIYIDGRHVPHVIFNTGDDVMWLLEKDYDASKEPFEVTNEQYIYNKVPRCAVTLESIDAVPDQMTSPYSRGLAQLEDGDTIMTVSAEMRRMPVKISVKLKYFLNTFTDTLNIAQQVLTKLTYIRTFKFTYLGQTILASYKVPESFSGEHLAEFDESTTDNRNRQIELSLEVESTLPVYAPRTAVDASKFIVYQRQTLATQADEISTRDTSTRHSD